MLERVDLLRGTPTARFTIALPSREPVHMCHSLTRESQDCSDREFAVVVVESEALLKLWRAERNGYHTAIAAGNPATWASDSKFHWAAKGFADGLANPVPLAQVSLEEYQPNERRSLLSRLSLTAGAKPYVTFSDGVTRTIWLLTYGAEAFPVKCRISSAIKLHRFAGKPGLKLLRNADMLSMLSE